MTRRRLLLALCLLAAWCLLTAANGCSSDGASDAARGGEGSIGSGAGGTSGAATATAGESKDAVWGGEDDGREIQEYQGLPLDTYFREYDNSIRGPQYVDVDTFRLRIGGLVDREVALTYDEVVALPRETRIIRLHCVEGWSERLVFEGVRLADVLAIAGPKGEATTLILHAVDGYSTSHLYADVERLDMMLADHINGRVLDEMRGFPFQLVAESKLGYKWIKWVQRIELSDEPYSGFWESRGYGNEADVPEEWRTD
jgi:DMSO/TMAO reductase YedYZ molybdopterin-dependent catalytic subunit